MIMIIMELWDLGSGMIIINDLLDVKPTGLAIIGQGPKVSSHLSSQQQ